MCVLAVDPEGMATGPVERTLVLIPSRVGVYVFACAYVCARVYIVCVRVCVRVCVFLVCAF